MAGRRGRLLLAAAVGLALALSGPLSAAADEPDPQPASQALRQQVRQLADEIQQLQLASDRAGVAAQKANEAYLDAKADAASARAVMVDARLAASAAVTKARESRARASAVAAQLARTDFGTLPLDLMLNHATADRVLGGLSNAGQLSTQAHVLYEQAVTDEAEARRLQDLSEQKARQAATAEKTASDAFDDATRQAEDAKQSVEAAKARETALIAQMTQQDGSVLGDVCRELDSTPDVCRVPSDPSAPAGSAAGSTGERVVAFARAQIGEPYVFAAAGPDSWDCSGITLGAYRSVGISIGIHSATAQYRTAERQGDLVPVKDAEPGDLLFYSDGGGDMYHVTVYAGHGMMIEAPYPGKDVREVPVRTGDLVAKAAHFA